MTTECSIGLVRPDGSVVSIMVYRDGYPEAVAPVLLDHYTSYDQVQALVALGELADLGKYVEVSDTACISETCIAYYRDRGEAFNQYVQPNTIDHKKLMCNNSVMHNYVFINDRWYYFDRSGSVEFLDQHYATILEDDSV